MMAISSLSRREADSECPQKLEFLSGWKDVANYLGKGVRTVQRYERELALPVRRPGGKSVASVIAIKADLDGWVATAPFRESLRLSRRPLRKNANDIRMAIKELKCRMLEFRRLHQENAELRVALYESVGALQRNLYFSLPEGTSPE